MSLIASATWITERTPLPDIMIRLGIDFLVSKTSQRLATVPTSEDRDFALAMTAYPIAEHVEACESCAQLLVLMVGHVPIGTAFRSGGPRG